MDFYALSPLVNVLTSIIAGLLILLADSKSRVNRIFFLFAGALAFWSFAYFLWQISIEREAALFWAHMLMAGSIWITPLYLHFVAAFLGEAKKLRIFIIFGYAAAVFFSIINWVSSSFITDVVPKGSFLFWPEPGIWYHLFLIVWAMYVIAPVILLVRHWNDPETSKRGSIKYILFGTIIGYIGGATSYFLWYDIPIPPFGVISASVYIAMVAYATTRFRLFNIQIVSAQILTIVLWLFLFVQLFFAETLQEQVMTGVALIFTVAIGFFLIRSVEKEVRQRELIEEQNKRLEQANVEKSEFMSFASHEIRNPLTAMRGYASMIAAGEFGEVKPEVKKAAQRIMITGQDVVSLIAQFLDKSKMELGELKYEKIPFDVNEAIREVAEGFQLSAQDKGLQLKVQTGSQRLVVEGDAGRIKSVIGNLIDNAIKYTKQGSVAISTERHGEAVRIVLEDTGDGIPDYVKPHLFKKFTRADARKRNLAGTGLGLYLAKQFVEAHDGRIWLESEGEGKGTTFIIELPLSHEKPRSKLEKTA